MRAGWRAATALVAGMAFAACAGGDGQDASSSSEDPAEAAPRVEAMDIDMVLQDGALLLDVRTAEELAEHGTLEGFVHIPVDELEARMGELPSGVPILTA